MDDSKISLWKEKGVAYVFNSRTNQNMPMYYQFYEDCIKNKFSLAKDFAISLNGPQSLKPLKP